MSLPISLDSIVVASAEHLSQSASEDALYMIDRNNGDYFHLNSTGRAIWMHLSQPIAVAALCEHLRESFDVTPAVSEQETLNFLNTMREKGLVRVEETS